LSRACAVASQEAMPGIFNMTEHVFYTGDNYTSPNGEKMVHGQQGEVMGPATSESHKGKGLCIRFPGNTLNVNCLLTQLSRSPPVSGATTCPIALVLHHYYPIAMGNAT
jgi:hypothetical protein